MNRQEAAQLVAVCLASCPQQSARIDQTRQLAMVDAFANLLDDLPYEQANAAVRVLLQTSPFIPAIADIRAKVLELKHGPVAAGGEAWGSVLKAMKREGSHRTPGVEFFFVDSVVAKCVAAMGWIDLCLSENTVADRARFIELYDALASQDRRERQAPLLAAARDAREAKQISAGDAMLKLIPKAKP